MHTPFSNHPVSDSPEQIFNAVADLTPATESSDPATSEAAAPSGSPFLFRGGYAGRMEMNAETQTVANYLDDHRAWFLRCAHPMTADPLGNNGYALTVGHFGALGYHIEPRIGLHLLPQEQGIYRIETIPIPGYEPPGYEVDFKASLQLNQTAPPDSAAILTQVEWELDLQVWVHFPRFIQALPRRVIQKTGDHLLSQIVRQVSRCLTHKVQEDFHQTLGRPFPESYRRRNHHFLERFSH